MSEDTEPRIEETTDQNQPEEPAAEDSSTSEKDWKHVMGESYRSWASWLSDEIETLDELGREKLQLAIDEINERFPAEQRQRLRDSAESEVHEFLGELKALGSRIRKTPKISHIEQKSGDAIRSSASKVREWAGQVEDKFAPSESESGTCDTQATEDDSE